MHIWRTVEEKGKKDKLTRHIGWRSFLSTSGGLRQGK
jgi:hypothetical protein